MITSPCVSNCCLDDEDVCLGCYRHVDEITGWHSADNQRRLQILENTQQRKAQKQRP
jgi:predicted Fe-S protein YdhL (DUF1289 family)